MQDKFAFHQFTHTPKVFIVGGVIIYMKYPVCGLERVNISPGNDEFEWSN
jgi:hypothetical protein